MPKDTKPQKVAGTPCLYKNPKTGEYIGIKKVKGGKKQESFETTNFSVAKRKLKTFVEQYETMTGEITLAQLCKRFIATKAGKKPKTIKTYTWTVKTLESFPLYNTSLHKIKPGDFAAFLASLTFKARSTHNLFVSRLGQILSLAVLDEYILKNPVTVLRDRFKKDHRKKPFAPTEEQFSEIINFIRTKSFERTATRYADCIELMGKAGIGEAEAKNLEWSHILWEKKVIQVTRVKTGKSFVVPFYDWLEPFLLEFWNRKGQPKTGKLFDAISDCNPILEIACRDLKFPHFTPRSLRSFCIVRLIRAGVGIKHIAAWQGHSDGGLLIMRVYSEVISENDAEQVQKELAKLKKAA